MNPPRLSFEQKRQIVVEMSRPILDFIHCRTVIVAAHNDSTVVDHGTGLLFEIDGDLVCATAGHVVQPYAVGQIQIIASEKLSDLRMQPIDKDCLGSGRQTEDDVAILRLPKDFARTFPKRQFHSIDDLELDPRGLGTDLAIACGAPESDHVEEKPKFYLFRTFTFFTSFDGGLEWSPPFGESPLIEIPFPTEVQDALTGKLMKLPEACGMSGGGMWRANLKPGQIWHPGSMRVVGLNTEFHRMVETVYATRAFKLLSLLSQHYKSAKGKLEKEVSWKM